MKISDISLEITVDDARWEQAIANISAVAEKVKDAVFGYLQKYEKPEFLDLEKPLKINVCLSDDATVQKLNAEFRGFDKPTNVLSFANLDFTDFAAQNAPFADIELGDIIVAYETMVKEAAELQITLYAHFCHLLTHGLLHLSGYDHIKPQEAAHMEHLETEILQTLQIANPYEED